MLLIILFTLLNRNAESGGSCRRCKVKLGVNWFKSRSNRVLLIVR
jgi:hypothetical protein